MNRYVGSLLMSGVVAMGCNKTEQSPIPQKAQEVIQIPQKIDTTANDVETGRQIAKHFSEECRNIIEKGRGHVNTKAEGPNNSRGFTSHFSYQDDWNNRFNCQIMNFPNGYADPQKGELNGYLYKENRKQEERATSLKSSPGYHIMIATDSVTHAISTLFSKGNGPFAQESSVRSEHKNDACEVNGVPQKDGSPCVILEGIAQKALSDAKGEMFIKDLIK